jgi:rhodanese-related sulfurtransferase
MAGSYYMSGIKSWLIFPLFLLGISLVFTGCSTGKASPFASSIPPQTTSTTSSFINQVIDTQTAYNLVQNNQNNPDFKIIDVRTPEEFKSGHIAGAINIDFYAEDFKTKISELARNKKYLVYCRSGNRSAQAAKIMLDLEFQEVYDMAGGITQWTSSGYPAVTD